MAGEVERGSFLCDAGHELRVTLRCLEDDLNLAGRCDFNELLQHEIIDAFCHQRHDKTHSGDAVGPAAGANTIYVLRRADRHRGATWFDEQRNVVWLCAYGPHQSGDPEDAFKYFKALIASGRMLPRTDDGIWLDEDLAHRPDRRLIRDARDLLEKARAAPHEEHRALIGGERVGVVIEIVETLQETTIVFSAPKLADYMTIVTVLAAFYPTRSYEEWEMCDQLPTRALNPDAGEICFRMFHE